MADKKAGGIFASSFVAGCLLAAAIFSPRAWEPVPGPYFGLEDASTAACRSEESAECMEVAHAELFARARARTTMPVQPDAPSVPRTVGEPPLSLPLPSATPPLATIEPEVTPGVEPMPVGAPLVGAPLGGARLVGAPLGGAPLGGAQPGETRSAEPLPAAAPTEGPPTNLAITDARQPEQVRVSPERIAMNDPTSPAAGAILADAVPPPLPPKSTVETTPHTDPPASLQAMMGRMQATHPSAAPSPRPTPEQIPAPITIPVPPPATPPASPQTWAQAFAAAPAVMPIRSQASDVARDPRQAGRVQSSHPSASAAPPGVPPLPGEPWTDPDGVNWSDVVASPPSTALPTPDGDRRRNWLGDWRHDPRGVSPRLAENRGPNHGGGGRLFDRLRGGDRRTAQATVTEADAPVDVLADTPTPDIGRWPQPHKLEQQFDHLATLATAAGSGAEPITGWTERARSAVAGVQDTRGPRDAAADASLILLGEAVIGGMSLADTTVDASLATHTRRAALAVARRVAVWRSTAAMLTSIDRDPEERSVNDAAAAMTRQAAGRTVIEIARLLDGIERFEVAPVAAHAEAVKASLRAISAFYPIASRPVARAVEDHYVAPNVRIAVHQQFLEKLLPGATVDTAPFQDTVMGHDVHGTRTVERTTTLRLVPDDDEICFNLEVHGDIASRAVTESGPVAVTARSNSAFTVRKPITISPQGLLFGNASGAASNRSRVDNIQTSFDAVPVMGSLVRTMAKNQQAESMPEANREVIDKIVSRACREVDTQAEPQFALMANRIRDRVWMPLVKLGLDPQPVAMQTTSSVATMRLRLAGETQLAAHTPRPRVPADAMLSLQLHESSANNAMDRLDIAGKRLTLEELIRHVSARIGIEPRIPEELPDGVAVTFAKAQPLRVECRDGLVHVQVALDAIESGRRDWYDLVVHVAYKPVCSGQQVFLEREGPVQLRGPGHEGRMELALRTIFGKIFPKERPMPLLPEKIAANEKMADVQAVQAVSSDGWLAITLEQRKSPPPVIASPPRPKAGRPAEARRKAIWR